ncbi:MAG: FkbH like protein, partial [uncultured Gemmatimonadetes bacterium]
DRDGGGTGSGEAEGCQVRGLGPGPHGVGRNPPGGRPRGAAPRDRGDPAHPGRARHPAVRRQPQRPRPGHAATGGARHRRILPLSAHQLERQGRERGGHRPEAQSGPRHLSLHRRPAVRARGGGVCLPGGAHARRRRPGGSARPAGAHPRARHRGQPQPPAHVPGRHRARPGRGIVPGSLGGLPAHAGDALQPGALRRRRPAARRRADGAHQPAQHDRLHVRVRRAERLSHLSPPPPPGRGPRRQVRHLRKDRPGAGGKDLGGVLDAQAAADVLPGDVARGGHHHDEPRDERGEGRRRKAARRVQAQRPQPDDGDHLPFRRLQGGGARGRDGAVRACAGSHPAVPGIRAGADRKWGAGRGM